MDLEDGKIYIGKTGNVQKRMKQHFSGDGARVTKKFKPIKCEVLDSCPGFLANEIEQLYTNKYIVEYGYNNVRGGKYTNSTSLHRTKINEETRKYMESDAKIIQLDDNYVPQDQVETKNEEEWLYIQQLYLLSRRT